MFLVCFATFFKGIPRLNAVSVFKNQRQSFEGQFCQGLIFCIGFKAPGCNYLIQSNPVRVPFTIC